MLRIMLVLVGVSFLASCQGGQVVEPTIAANAAGQFQKQLPDNMGKVEAQFAINQDGSKPLFPQQNSNTETVTTSNMKIIEWLAGDPEGLELLQDYMKQGWLPIGYDVMKDGFIRVRLFRQSAQR